MTKVWASALHVCLNECSRCLDDQCMHSAVERVVSDEVECHYM